MVSSVSVNPQDFATILLRLGVAMLVGGGVGWTRQLAGKAAGLRTHMLVTTTAALFVLISAQIPSPHLAESLSYSLQGISTGVGFLGAGVILRQVEGDTPGATIKGLTSASEIWVAAALGAAAGCGLWLLSGIGGGLMILILTGFKRLERLIPVHGEAGE
jgi:putative Mg2+ transporter-C (MgtC) family protein